MGANENTLSFLGFIVKHIGEGAITISDTRYKDKNSVTFKNMGGVMVLLPDKTITPEDVGQHSSITVTTYIHIAEAADAFFNKLNEGGG